MRSWLHLNPDGLYRLQRSAGNAATLAVMASVTGRELQREVDEQSILKHQYSPDEAFRTTCQAYINLKLTSPAYKRLQASDLVTVRFGIEKDMPGAHGRTTVLADGKAESVATKDVRAEDSRRAWAEALRNAKERTILITLNADPDIPNATDTVTHELAIHGVPALNFIEAAVRHGAVGAASLDPDREFHIEHQRHVSGQITDWAQTLHNLVVEFTKKGDSAGAVKVLSAFKEDWESERYRWLQRLVAQYRGWARQPMKTEPSAVKEHQIRTLVDAAEHDETPEQKGIRARLIEVDGWDWASYCDYLAGLGINLPRSEGELRSKSGTGRTMPAAELGIMHPLYRPEPAQSNPKARGAQAPAPSKASARTPPTKSVTLGPPPSQASARTQAPKSGFVTLGPPPSQATKPALSSTPKAWGSLADQLRKEKAEEEKAKPETPPTNVIALTKAIVASETSREGTPLFTVTVDFRIVPDALRDGAHQIISTWAGFAVASSSLSSAETVELTFLDRRSRDHVERALIGLASMSLR